MGHSNKEFRANLPELWPRFVITRTNKQTRVSERIAQINHCCQTCFTTSKQTQWLSSKSTWNFDQASATSVVCHLSSATLFDRLISPRPLSAHSTDNQTQALFPFQEGLTCKLILSTFVHSNIILQHEFAQNDDFLTGCHGNASAYTHNKTFPNISSLITKD